MMSNDARLMYDQSLFLPGMGHMTSASVQAIVFLCFLFFMDTLRYSTGVR